MARRRYFASSCFSMLLQGAPTRHIPPLHVSSTSRTSTLPLPRCFPTFSIVFTSYRIPRPRSPPPIVLFPVVAVAASSALLHVEYLTGLLCSAARPTSQRRVTSFPSLKLFPLEFPSCPSLHAPPQPPHPGPSPFPRPIASLRASPRLSFSFSFSPSSLSRRVASLYISLLHSASPLASSIASLRLIPPLPTPRRVVAEWSGVSHHRTSRAPRPRPSPPPPSPSELALISLLFAGGTLQGGKIRNKNP
ncbi:hypothetical protein C8R44DRAFT_888084 [Mycena epipterygia]|nr:hypothetical protein C8R44DRAFT_888084 [Mycena epipterygia]